MKSFLNPKQTLHLEGTKLASIKLSGCVLVVLELTCMKFFKPNRVEQFGCVLILTIYKTGSGDWEDFLPIRKALHT